MFFNYNISFIQKSENELNLERFHMSELTNEYSIQRVINLFFFDKDLISYFSYNLTEDFKKKYRAVIDRKNIKGVLLLNFPELEEIVDAVLQINDEQSLFQNNIFSKTISLINSYYKSLVSKNEQVSLKNKLKVNITEDEIKNRIYERLKLENETYINNFKKVFSNLINELVINVKKFEDTETLLIIRRDIIKKYVIKYESKLLKLIYSPIKKEDPFCVIVAKTMKDNLSELIYFFKDDKYPIRINDVCQIIVYFCYHYHSECLVSCMGKI